MQISWDDIAPALVGAETPVFAALNVDERTREQIILKIKSLFPDRFFLYISHNVIEVARFCRQVLVLRGAIAIPGQWTVPGLDAEGEAAASPALEKPCRRS
jgi:ABC-type Mn2+/Zn2+ transport system ATPase subunit